MRTAIDTNVISSIWSGEPSAPDVALRLSMAKLEGALLLCPAVFSELHAYPGVTANFIANFLRDTGIAVDYRLEDNIWSETGVRFARYAARRRQSGGSNPRRLLADFVIGAHALLQAERLFTLDPNVYQLDFPEVKLL